MKQLLLAFVVLGAGSTASFAQGAGAPTPLFEVSGGYRLLDPDNDGGETIERGWYADTAYNLNRIVGLVVQTGGSYESVATSFSNEGITFDGRGSVRLHDVLGGVRLTDRRSQRVTWFGQALAGLVHASVKATVRFSGAGFPAETETFDESNQNFGFQFGGGLGVRVAERLGLRVGVDSLRIFEEDESGNVFRIAAGVVIPIGVR